ncbi:MAG: KpsF/GutQ family sugar-phosphate isomerase [Nitratireductor sp.]|jgi:arabinose-5-phosphate isomerase|nr:KpsF/GutQ family sugar-phosphate isomerase [Nitratireductor sp.]
MTHKAMEIASAIRTIETERNGLAALTQAFDAGLAEPFSRAVAGLSKRSGRVIVTGMGKSGHIGAKIAATLASTGTPAYFVHPAEANHGDLGMITADDAVIAISWSGESAELKGIVAYTRRFSIPLIAITANPASALGRESDICLTLPKVPEACPHQLAPTTSTLMQLALGDALAIALLESRDFSASDFKVLHPGGSLGASLTHVSEVMHGGDAMPVVPVGTAMDEAVRCISAKGFGCVAITAPDGTLAGIVTDGDLRRNISRNLAGLKVEDVMTRSPQTVSPETLASKAMAILNQRSITALMVTVENRPVGIVHMHDLLRIGVA